MSRTSSRTGGSNPRDVAERLKIVAIAGTVAGFGAIWTLVTSNAVGATARASAASAGGADGSTVDAAGRQQAGFFGGAAAPAPAFANAAGSAGSVGSSASGTGSTAPSVGHTRRTLPTVGGGFSGNLGGFGGGPFLSSGGS